MPDCSKCSLDKPLSEFYKDKSKPTGHQSWCKECQKLGKRRESQVKYARWLHIKRTYGLTEDDYNQMLVDQNHGCKICKVTKSSNRWSGELHIDHDHATGEIRGLLCFNCNNALGMLKDDVVLLERAIAYLKGNL